MKAAMLAQASTALATGLQAWLSASWRTGEKGNGFTASPLPLGEEAWRLLTGSTAFTGT